MRDIFRILSGVHTKAQRIANQIDAKKKAINKAKANGDSFSGLEKELNELLETQKQMADKLDCCL